MALKVCMWVHGNIVQVEKKADKILRIGWGTKVNQQFSVNWFHIPIATPVILDDIRPLLIKAFVLYKAGGGTKVTNIHVYDGKTKVKAIDGLSLSGDHSGAIDASNSWVIDPPITIKYGLGISIGVSFGDEGEILFTAAGADFKKP